MHEYDPTHEQQPRQLRPRIWIGSLADYNAGRLHGEWVDAAVDPETLNNAVKDILDASVELGAEEFAIFDYDEFGNYRPGEYEPLDQVAAVARGIAEHGPAFAAWAELHDGEPDMLGGFEDAYLGAWDSAEDWGREVLLDETLEAELDRAVPDSLRGYVSIDYVGFARDAELSGDVHIEPNGQGGVWIFRIV